MNTDKIKQTILETIENYLKIEKQLSNFSYNENYKLFGGDGVLDSMDLVQLIVQIESDLFEKYSIEISIANERAMSKRNSPFSKIKYLLEFIIEEINLGE